MLRFGVSALPPSDAGAWRATAAAAETAGFDVFYVADHIGMFDPFGALVAAGGATERIHLGTYVLNAEFWNPLLLARAAATTDVLTGGRLLLGLGAGHAQVEFEQAGLRYPRPSERIARLERVVPAVRRLLDGETVDDDALGLRGAATGLATGQPRVPILVGGNGDRVLRLAATEADAVGLAGFTSGTGQVHTDLSHWTWDGLADRLALVRTAAGAVAPPTVDLLAQRVVVCDDRDRVAKELAEATGTPAAAHLDSPFLLLGTEDEIAAQLRRTNELGVDRVTVLSAYANALAPIIDQLKR